MTRAAALADNQKSAESSYRTDGSLAARILVTVVGTVTLTGAYIADWNVTHIYHPTWPPHAKFHNAQTMLLAAALGLCTLVYDFVLLGLLGVALLLARRRTTRTHS